METDMATLHLLFTLRLKRFGSKANHSGYYAQEHFYTVANVYSQQRNPIYDLRSDLLSTSINLTKNGKIMLAGDSTHHANIFISMILKDNKIKKASFKASRAQQ